MSWIKVIAFVCVPAKKHQNNRTNPVIGFKRYNLPISSKVIKSFQEGLILIGNRSFKTQETELIKRKEPYVVFSHLEKADVDEILELIGQDWRIYRESLEHYGLVSSIEAAWEVAKKQGWLSQALIKRREVMMSVPQWSESGGPDFWKQFGIISSSPPGIK